MGSTCPHAYITHLLGLLGTSINLQLPGIVTDILLFRILILADLLWRRQLLPPAQHSKESHHHGATNNHPATTGQLFQSVVQYIRCRGRTPPTHRGGRADHAETGKIQICCRGVYPGNRGHAINPRGWEIIFVRYLLLLLRTQFPLGEGFKDFSFSL